MTATLRKSPQSPMNHDKICDERINRAKMKNEANKAALAPENKKASTSRQSQRLDHLHAADQEPCALHAKERKEGATMTAEDWQTLGFSFDAAPNKSLKIDTFKYQALFDDADITDDQKEEIILELWKIIIPFVDLGFQVSPLDLACGKLAQSTDHTGNQDSAMLKSDKSRLTDTFNQFAAE